MANEPSIPAQTQFRLTPSQMIALHVIEMAQSAIAAAGQRVSTPICDEKDASKLLEEAQRVLESAKVEWLKATQKVVTLAASPVVPDIAGLPDRVRANGRHL